MASGFQSRSRFLSPIQYSLEHLQMFGCLAPNRPRQFPSLCADPHVSGQGSPHAKHELKALRVRDRTTEFLIGANLKTQTQFHLLRWFRRRGWILFGVVTRYCIPQVSRMPPPFEIFRSQIDVSYRLPRIRSKIDRQYAVDIQL